MSVAFENRALTFNNRPPTKLRKGNAFSCVCPLCDHYQWCVGPHHIGIPQALPSPGHGIPVCRDPSANALPPRPQTWTSLYRDLSPHPRPQPCPPQTCSSLFNFDLTVQGHWLQLSSSSSSQACSNLFITKHIHLASNRFASYQSAFCLENTVAVRTQIATAAIPLQGSKLKCGKWSSS